MAGRVAAGDGRDAAAFDGTPSPDSVLSALLGTSTDCITILDLDGTLLAMNEGGCAAMEVDDVAATKGRSWPSLWIGEYNERAKAAVAAARVGQATRFRGPADTVKGMPKYWDVQVAPIRGPKGEPSHVLVVSRDVSQERRNEARLLEIARRASENARTETENLRRLLHDAPSIMVVLRGPDHVIELANQAALQLAGYRDILGLAVREAFPDADGQVLVEVLDAVLATGKPFVAADAPVKLQRRPDAPFEDAFLNLALQPIKDEHGAFTGVLVEGTEITARVRAERSLARSERRLRLAQEVAGIGSLEVDIAIGDVRGSKQFWRLWGLDDAQSVDISVLEQIVVPEDRHLTSNPETRVAGAVLPQVEYRIKRPDTGEIRWLARHIEFVEGADGKPVQMIGVMQDITERKHTEEQRALLTRELAHRMKNTLAMVGALATQTLKGDDMDAARTAFASRLAALSAANDILTARHWSGAAIGAVVEGALAPHVTDEDRMQLGGPDLRLGAKQALALSLSLHELATNAAKYGALSNASGTVAITWAIEAGVEGSPQLQLTWVERGGPPVVAPARRGVGSQLIEGVLAADFGGTARIEYGSSGVSYILEAPLGNLPPQPTDAST